MSEELVRIFITQEDMDAAYYAAAPDGTPRFPKGNHRPFFESEFAKQGWIIHDWRPLKFMPGSIDILGTKHKGILVVAPKGALGKL